MASLNQFDPVLCAWQIDSIRNSVACHVTSNLDFDKGSCVIQVEWTMQVTLVAPPPPTEFPGLNVKIKNLTDYLIFTLLPVIDSVL